MNANRRLQLVFYRLFLTTTVGRLLAITTGCHRPVMTVWAILAITAAIVCAAGSLERHNNQKEEEK